jgi:hypothetical protein
MATAPMDSEDPSMDPTAGESAEPPEGESSDFVIEIKVSGQGIQVGVESASEESAESGESGSDEENYQTVQSIGEACRLVREIYASQGQMQSPSVGAEQMDAGYKR